MPQGPYGRGPSQINIPVQKRKQKRMTERTKERKKKDTKTNDIRETKTAQIKSAIHSKLPYACSLRNQKISIRSFSFTRKVLTNGKLKTGFYEGGRRVGLPTHEIS